MSDGDKNDAHDVFEIERIKRLVELMEEHDLSEVDLQQDNERIKLKRGGTPAAVAPTPTAIPTAPVAAQPAAATPAPADNRNIVTVDAPMVGTFYSRANPDSEPLVKVGSTVQPDTVVCIVEAMKVFNEIPAEVSGKIVEILAKDQEPVEFGKPLFKVDTSA